MRWSYTSDGLVVWWYKTKAPAPQRVALIAEVWQLYVQGGKPKGLKGASDERVRVSRPTSQEPEIGTQSPSRPAKIGNREFAGKAIDLMSEANHSAVEVEEVIARAKKVARGDYFCYWGWSLRPMIDFSACTDSSGRVWVVTP
jgi:hypothetical protein